tara:strand:+ start:195 stop:911 length:717 start_codon:yes stop_codon:yes gene_type:complete
MESLFKLLADFFLRLENFFKWIFKLFLQGMKFQQAQLFVTIVLICLTILMVISWKESSIWERLLFAVIYIIVFLFCSTVIYYYIIKKKEAFNKNQQGNDFNLKAYKDLDSIVEGADQMQKVFVLFSGSYFAGDYKSFESLLLLKYLKESPRLVWIDRSPNNPHKINRQTLLEFLSQVFFGFENLSNIKIVEFINHYFTMEDDKGKHLRISTKNVSDWRNNSSPYLKRISILLNQTIHR